MARAALKWSVRDLAERAQISPTTVSKVEAEEDVRAATLSVIQHAFAEAGVEFTNGDAPGVRLRKGKTERKGMVTVYHFKVWDHQRGENITPPFKSPIDRIEEAKGEVLPDTAEEVHQSALDAERRYNPKTRA